MAGGREEFGMSQFVKVLEQVAQHCSGLRTNRKYVYFFRTQFSLYLGFPFHQDHRNLVLGNLGFPYHLAWDVYRVS